MCRTLLFTIFFYDGRYHGVPDWPPSPARLFQALVAGAARGQTLSPGHATALTWLETLDAPSIVAPATRRGNAFTNFVPNNDLDAVGRDPKRTAEIRTAKLIRPQIFDAAIPLLYLWSFEPAPEAEAHAPTLGRRTAIERTEDLLALRLDGATKELFVWGLRCGFISIGPGQIGRAHV